MEIDFPLDYDGTLLQSAFRSARHAHSSRVFCANVTGDFAEA